jgi:hypothetical protein
MDSDSSIVPNYYCLSYLSTPLSITRKPIDRINGGSLHFGTELMARVYGVRLVILGKLKIGGFIENQQNQLLPFHYSITNDSRVYLTPHSNGFPPIMKSFYFSIYN